MHFISVLFLFPISSPASMWYSSILFFFMCLQRTKWQSRITIKTSLYWFPPNFGVASSTDHFYELSWALMKFYEHLAWDIAGWFFQDKSVGRIRAVLPMVGVGILRPLSSPPVSKTCLPFLLSYFPFPRLSPFIPFLPVSDGWHLIRRWKYPEAEVGCW